MQQSEKVSDDKSSNNSRANSNDDANSTKHLEAIKNLNVSSEYKLGKMMMLNRNLETDDDQVEMGEVPALSHQFGSVPKTNLTKPLKKQNEQSDYSSNTIGVIQ